MKGSELIDRAKAYARTRDLHWRYDPRSGKGSHGRLELGERFTTIKDPKKEIAAGLLAAMLKQLCVSKEDLGD